MERLRIQTSQCIQMSHICIRIAMLHPVLLHPVPGADAFLMTHASLGGFGKDWACL
ncbi:MAG: hypothetical protein ACRCYY_12585 [Trueperaceae bacterium]